MAWIQLRELGERDKEKLIHFARLWCTRQNYSAEKIQMIVDDINNAENGLPVIATFRKHFPRGTGVVGLDIRA